MKNLNLTVRDTIAVIEFDQPDSKVNVLNTETMTEFAGVIDDLMRRPQGEVRGLLITSKKKGIFIAGADIQEIEHITSIDLAKEKADKGKEVLDRLAALDLVTISVINGACLGGGLEL
ncbi:MAG: enoyl-CoA hydratase-related protein, partial [Candidatus Omnitrophota bacterium]